MTVKYGALEPDARRDHKTSVYRTLDLNDQEIWHLGDERVGRPRGKDVIARAEITVEDVRSHGLLVEADDKPPRHANIAGWPAPKDEYRTRAMELARDATLRIRAS